MLLIKIYRKCKAQQSTGCSPLSWIYYGRVHRIIGNGHVNNIDVIVVNSIAGKFIHKITNY